MKRTLLVPVTLLIHTVLFGIVILGGVALYHGSFQWVLSYGGVSILGALFAALLVTTGRSVFRPTVPPLFLLLIFLSVLLLAGGIVALDLFVFSPGAADPVFSGTVPEDVVLQGEKVALVVGSRNGTELTDVILVTHREVPVLHRYASGIFNGSTGEATLFPGGTSVSVAGLAGVFSAADALPLQGILEDLAEVYGTLRAYLRGGDLLALSIYAVSLSLALAMVWTPLRLVRWPLLNFALGVGYLRAMLLVPFEIVLPEWVPAPAATVVTAWSAPVIWSAVSLIMVVVALLLPTLARWQREMPGAVGAQ